MSRPRPPAWALPGQWADEGLCAALGWENWEDTAPDDQRALCEACPVLEWCARWASGFVWVETTVAGRSYGSDPGRELTRSA